jgi:hypothetical protein
MIDHFGLLGLDRGGALVNGAAVMGRATVQTVTEASSTGGWRRQRRECVM